MTIHASRQGFGDLAVGAAPARILIVEDEPLVARNLEMTLARFGWDVVGSVSTGEEAVLRASEAPLDVVLMDIHLDGELDGVEAAEAIGHGSDTAVIFLTADADPDTQSRVAATSPFGYILKPFDPAELRAAVMLALHRRRLDARLRAQTRWLTTTLRSIGEAVVASGSDRRIKLLNPVAERLLGCGQEQALGRLLDDVVRIEAAGPEALELIAADGHRVPVERTESAILDDDGVPIGEVLVLRDVSERRRAEAAIRDLNASLEHRVAERTQALAEANRELEAFNYSVAHDLRGPLRVIHGLLEILSAEIGPALDGRTREYMARIQAAARRGDQLVMDLLRLSSVGRAELARGQVDLSNLARAVGRGLQQAEPGRQVELEVEDAIIADGDLALLRVLLENLLGNAWKFTRRVERARVSFGELRQNGRRTFFVRDNGIGFDPAHAKRLMRPFERLHADQGYEGQGIGLALAERIAVRHGGSIRAEASPGEGATFFFTL